MVWTTRTLISGVAAGAVGILLAALVQAPAMAATPNPILGDGSCTRQTRRPSWSTTRSTSTRAATRPSATHERLHHERVAGVLDHRRRLRGSGSTTPSLMRPEAVFDWATPGRAYAGQVVEGIDGRYYWYVPVHEAASTVGGQVRHRRRREPTTRSAPGPTTRAARSCRRSILGNTIHNIDPTVFVDDDGTRARCTGAASARLRRSSSQPT